MGDVIADEDEVFGDDVNIAVRLEFSRRPPAAWRFPPRPIGRPASISAPTLVDTGSHRLKNIGEMVDVWAWEPRRVPAPAQPYIKNPSLTCRLSIEPRSSACFPSPISATAPTNISPTG